MVATLVTVGDDEQRTANQARIYVKLIDPDKRKISQDQLKARVRDKVLPVLPADLRVNIADVNEFGGGQPTARIQYLLAGPDLKVLEGVNKRVLERMKKVPGAVDVDSSMIMGKPELGVYVDRNRAADLGVQVMDVAMALQFLSAGRRSPPTRTRASSTTCACAPPRPSAPTRTRCSCCRYRRASWGWCRSPTW